MFKEDKHCFLPAIPRLHDSLTVAETNDMAEAVVSFLSILLLSVFDVFGAGQCGRTLHECISILVSSKRLIPETNIVFV